MSCAARLLAHVRAASQRVAFRCEAESLTWSQLERRASSYAQALREVGVTAGDRVVTIAGPCLDNVVVLLGHYLVGAVHVPVNTRYRRAELEHVITDSGATLLVCDAAGAAALGDALDLGAEIPTRWFAIDGAEKRDAPSLGAPIGTLRGVEAAAPATGGPAPLPPDDALALMIYTSGTTGPSKGVCHSFASVVDSMQALTDAWGWSAADHQALALPLFHVHGLCIGVHGALLHGAQTQILRRFDCEALHTAFERGATVFMGVPTMYAMWLDWLEAAPARAEALRAARLFTAGSAALSARNFARFEALTGHRILERYGMSETLITLSNPYEGERRPGSVGRAVPGFEVRIVDEAGDEVADGELGEIRVRGVGLMQGYWQQAAATARAYDERGWFKTGDVARVGEGGYLSIEGRSSVDIIKSGGFKVSAREIEEALLESGRFADVAVLGVQDPTWGERIVAAVVPAATAEPSASLSSSNAADEGWLESVRVCLAGVLADYKHPRVVRVVEAIPKNALGKVQKHRLRPLFADGDGTEAGRGL